ncbi:MAG: PQQ-like beta-propeller repeat protein [Desulfobacterales bacterium]|nr:PQQ-like beta-propeller repeat protein [Desulfobacterales bacterium]
MRWIAFLFIWLCWIISSIAAEKEITPIWTFNANDPVVTTPAISNNNDSVFIATKNGKVFSLALKTGIKQWEFNSQSQISSSPVVTVDNNIIISDETGNVYALSCKNGSVIWKLFLNNPIKSSPAIGIDGTIYVGSSNQLYGIDPVTGTDIWKFQAEGAIETTPSVSMSGNIFFTCTRNYLYSLTPDGKKSWIFNIGSSSQGPIPLDRLENIFFGDFSGQLRVIKLGELKSNVVIKKDGIIRCSPVLGRAGKHIFEFWSDPNKKAKLYRFTKDENDTNNWKTDWTFDGIDDWVVSPPALDDEGNLYFGSVDKKIYSINSENGTLNWSYSTGGRITGSPVIKNNMLIVGSTDGKIYAFSVGKGDWPMLSQGREHQGMLQSEYNLPGEELVITPPDDQVWVLKILNDAKSHLINITPPEKAQIGQIKNVGGNLCIKIYAAESGRVTVGFTKENEYGKENEKQKKWDQTFFIAGVPKKIYELGSLIPRPAKAENEISPCPKYMDQKDTKKQELSSSGEHPFYWNDKTKKLFGINPGEFRLFWNTEGGTEFSMDVILLWPQKESKVYQPYIASSPGIDFNKLGFQSAKLIAYKELNPNSNPDISEISNNLQRKKMFFSSMSGDFLVFMSDKSNFDEADDFYLQFIRSVNWNDPNVFTDNAHSIIGEEIIANSDIHNPLAGDPYVFKPLARYATTTDSNKVDGDFFKDFYSENNRKGPIIPINIDIPERDDDDMVIIYYQSGEQLMRTSAGLPIDTYKGWIFEKRFFGTQMINQNGFAKSPKDQIIGWPCKVVRYKCQWPDISNINTGNIKEPQEIIIASSKGSGKLDETIFAEQHLYYQNESNKPGFNPNDEHTINKAGIFYPLRCDLGDSLTSEPWVLISYKDRQADNRPKMKLFHVIAENSVYHFRITGDAGKMIDSPPPLEWMKENRCSQDCNYSPIYRDRTDRLWAMSAGDNGEEVEIVMQFYYPARTNFYYPDFYLQGEKPEENKPIPWLDQLRNPKSKMGDPLGISFVIRWPKETPAMRVGESIISAKYNINNIIDQMNVKIIYQQSLKKDNKESINLIDAISPRSVLLEKKPNDAELKEDKGKIYFSSLPPNLKQRLYYDEQKKELCFQGIHKNELGIGDYVLLNVITKNEKITLDKISQDIAFKNAMEELFNKCSEIIKISGDEEESFTGKQVLTAGLARGTGYATLIFNDSKKVNKPEDTITMQVIKVEKPLVRGGIIKMLPENPFQTLVSLRQYLDFSGKPEEYFFEWRAAPPEDGKAPYSPYDTWTLYSQGEGLSSIEINKQGRDILSDLYFVCRYRPKDSNHLCGNDWPVYQKDGKEVKGWTEPVLVEGWLKRILIGDGKNVPITPFQQKFKDFESRSVNRLVSMISQAGPRWEGNIPLNWEQIEKFGLIEIFETIFKEAVKLSIEGLPPVNDYPPINAALLLGADRLSKLYMLLGNEAYADAIDSTIALETDSPVWAFKGQMKSLLDEELTLLRGRSDEGGTNNVRISPCYNRLMWNNAGAAEGEAFYNVNYNIQNKVNKKEDTENSRLNYEDAMHCYPQGHGDAWGHYLTALKIYYRLLRNENFGWDPNSEEINIGGARIKIDFDEESNFAKTAAAKARTGAQIVSLTHRQMYDDTYEKQCLGYSDDDTNRVWGVSEWSSRVGQGAYFDWVMANALLPYEDKNPNHEGVQKIDRKTVFEINDIPAMFVSIQDELDKSDAGLNPLGFEKNTLCLDVNKDLYEKEGKTPFWQAYNRAKDACQNAFEMFQYASQYSLKLRNQQDSLDNFNESVERQEVDYKSQMIEIFGYPYPEDIGPGKTYPANYDGPDIYHYNYISLTEQLGIPEPETVTQKIFVKECKKPTQEEILKCDQKEIFLNVSEEFGQITPKDWKGRRRAPGEIQISRSQLIQTIYRYESIILSYKELLDNIEDTAELFRTKLASDANEIQILNRALQEQQTLNQFIRKSRNQQTDFRRIGQRAKLVSDALSKGVPDIFGVIAGMAGGVIADVGGPAQAAISLAGVITNELMSLQADREADAEIGYQQAKEIIESKKNIEIMINAKNEGYKQNLQQLERLIQQEPILRLEIYSLRESLIQATGRYRSAVARGERITEQRTSFQNRTAVMVQKERYKDMAFRIFRDDTLQKFHSQFDYAAMLVYLTAQIYDYETNFHLDDRRNPGKIFMNNILRARDTGILKDGKPLKGSGGLLGILADLEDAYTQIAYKNTEKKQLELSLKGDFFKVNEKVKWQEILTQHRVDDIHKISEVTRFCGSIPGTLEKEPGIVIPFSTFFDPAGELDIFGWPAKGGSKNFNISHYSTRLLSVGVGFTGYDPTTLRATVFVYLIPTGSDIFKIPSSIPVTQGNFTTRIWHVYNSSLPVQNIFARSNIDNLNSIWTPFSDVKKETGFFAPQKYSMIEVTHAFNSPKETLLDPQLVARSVYNNRWILVIPGVNLSKDREEGLKWFIDNVEDISIYLSAISVIKY